MEILNKNTEEFSAIGKPVRRVVGRAKVTGGLRYTAEIPVENMLYAFPVLATVAAGTIERTNADEIGRMPGVVKVYTHENVAEIGVVSVYGLVGRGGE